MKATGKSEKWTDCLLRTSQTDRSVTL